ncbi:MAG TPA: hypothetical protein PLJ92_04995 [Methanospirillum hungatei]|nr:hypothetical protein [Methanospirillum hungatei]
MILSYVRLASARMYGGKDIPSYVIRPLIESEIPSFRCPGRTKSCDEGENF